MSTSRDGILLPGEGDDEYAQRNLLEIMAHPITRVFVDEFGVVCYERHDADPIKLNAIDPHRSRQEALHRLVAALDTGPPENDPRRDMPISESLGIGLTYNQLKMQTAEAVKKSREVQAEHEERAAAKAAKYNLD